ncbi:MAG: 3-deoxy-8-phosphooctulonate synthase [Thermodesulfobacteriota bacterium]
MPVGRIHIGGGEPLVLIAGPCVIEDEDSTFRTAEFLKSVTNELRLPFVFKASFDKANRTSIHSFRGPGLDEGLSILKKIKETLGVAVISDVHLPEQVEAAAEVLDIIQVPAFLCRQTDFILRAAGSGKTLNIKKGQFLAPWDVKNIVEKASSSGNRNILITERGTMFGYNNLVVDFRGIPIIQKETRKPVIFDATHSVQLPGGGGSRSGGERAFAPLLAGAAVAAGADGIFMEVHEDPEKALCDGPNSLYLDSVRGILLKLQAIRDAIRQVVK